MFYMHKSIQVIFKIIGKKDKKRYVRTKGKTKKNKDDNKYKS